MASHAEAVDFGDDSNDDVVVLSDSDAEKDTTHRPLSGVNREMAQKELARRAEIRQLMADLKKTKSAATPTDQE